MELLIITILGLISINIAWMFLNWQSRRIYKNRRQRLISWMYEVPEYWGIDRDLWEIEMKKFKLLSDGGNNE